MAISLDPIEQLKNAGIATVKDPKEEEVEELKDEE